MTKLKEQNGYIPNSVSATIESLEHVRNEMAALKKLEEEIKDKLVESFDLASAYKSKSEPFGVVNFAEGDYKVSFTTPKKVKYDQAGLAKLAKLGAPVDVEYSVKETVFKALDDDGKAAFMQYRTVEPGAISIKVEKADGFDVAG